MTEQLNPREVREADLEVAVERIAATADPVEAAELVRSAAISYGQSLTDENLERSGLADPAPESVGVPLATTALTAAAAAGGTVEEITDRAEQLLLWALDASQRTIART